MSFLTTSDISADDVDIDPDRVGRRRGPHRVSSRETSDVNAADVGCPVEPEQMSMRAMSMSVCVAEVAAVFCALIESVTLAGVEPAVYLQRAAEIALAGGEPSLPHEVPRA
jgi:hypothetical protein